MRKIKLYLETSVWNFLFADDAPEKKEETIAFFAGLDFEVCELYVSELVFKEIRKAHEPVQTILHNTINEFHPVILEINEEVGRLASIYMSEDFLPEKAFDDLQHIAIATVYGMDFLLSWNLKHIANEKSMLAVNKINVSEGYKKLKLSTIKGVLLHDDERT